MKILNYILCVISLLLLSKIVAYSQLVPDTLNTQKDSLKLSKIKETLPKDSLRIFTAAQKDSILLDSLKRVSSFEASLIYSADDSIVFDLNKQELALYHNAKTTYRNQNLEAHRIRVEWKTNMMYANGIYDTTGKLIGTPIFKEKDDIYYAEQIAYNTQTRKGKIYFAKTNKNGDIVIGDSIKRTPDEAFFIKNGKFTTCDAEHPHFYIQSRKLKMIPNDKVVSGPLYMVIADVPIPIIIPFGFFPFRQKRTSGIIIPNYGKTNDRGFFFRNMGFYWAVNDYLDLKLLGDIYTNGSFRLSSESVYNKRYRYQGNFSLEYSNELFNQPGDPDFSKNTGFFVRWNHNQPISPLSRFSTNVNAGTRNFLQRNRFNVNQNLQNTLQSSISFSQSFPRHGWSLTANADHRQDMANKTVSLNLPSIVINKDRIFPFKTSNRIGEESWYERIGVTYSSEIRNQIDVADSILFSSKAREFFKNGMRHGAGVNTNFKVLKYITVTPALNYRELWYLKTYEKNYEFKSIDTLIKEGDSLVAKTITTKTLIENKPSGFAAARDFNSSISMNTIIYGLLLTKGKRQRAFRHVMTPSASYTYTPDFGKDFWGYYKTIVTNPEGNQTERYSRFQQGIFGGPSAGEQQIISFALNNQIEMKYLPDEELSKTDTVKKKFKYITLFDNIGTSASYNLAADSLKLSNIPLNIRNNILNNLVNINTALNFDPYTFDQKIKRRINEFIWNGEKRLPRMTNASVSIALNLRPKDKKNTPVPQNIKTNSLQDSSQNQNAQSQRLAEKQKLISQYKVFNMPYNFGISYTANVTNNFNTPLNKWETKTVHSLNLNANIEFTKNWVINGSTNYDVERKKVGTTSITITRDLHCWQLSFNTVPFGRFQRYMLTINVKANTLKDLKIEKRREWQDQFTNQF